MSIAYSRLAKFYDSLMCDFDYKKYYNNIASLISGDVVELCVGSGLFTKLYADSVNSVLGVDNSADMLSKATVNLKKQKNVQLVLDNCEKFKPIKKVDTVLAVCDGFNYVENFNGLIKHINKYLKTDGYLIFDISSSYKLTKVIGNNIFYEDLQNLTYIWTNKLEDNKIAMDLTFFIKNENNYDRQDEFQVQYIHEKHEVEKVLSENGFIIKVIDGENFSDCTAESPRLLFICQKGS